MHQLKIHENQIWHKSYNQYYYFSTLKKGYSGVSTFSKIKPKDVRYGIGVEKFDVEGRVLTLEYDNFYLINVYVPNAQPKLARINERVEFNSLLDDYI